MNLEELISASDKLDRASFVERYPEPALLFVRGLPGQKPSDKDFDADDTHAVEFQTTTEVPIPSRAIEKRDMVGLDAIVVFLKKRSPWTPFADVLTVGRATIQDVCIPLPSVSKFHVCLTRDPSGWKVTDQRSVNGTFVDGKQLEPGGAARLRDGTRLGFGHAAEAVFFTADGLHDFVAGQLDV